MKLDLEENLEEVKRFHQKDVYERIELWYQYDTDIRDEETGWDRPPYRFLCERAGELIRFSLEIWDDQYRQSGLYEYPPVTETRDILLLVGTEALLTAIAMKEDPKWFITHCDKRGRTPSFGFLIEEKVPEWIIELPEHQQARVKTVLRILKEHRNNLVHFGLHQIRHNPDYPAYYDVLAYLFGEFLDSELEVIEYLEIQSDRIQQTHPKVDYQWLYFSFED